MRHQKLPLILALVIVVAQVVAATAQTNTSAPLILPPPDWDARTHRLASLVATNKPGEYPLPMTWTGVEQVTTRFGWYARLGARADGEQADAVIEFDKFTVSSEPVPPMLRGGYLSKGTQGYGWAAYRATLPSDSELLQMRDISSVSNLFGWSPFSKSTNSSVQAPASQAPRIRLFTLRPYDSIETLQVTFMRRGQESTIDSIMVRRGLLHPPSTKH